METIMVSFDAHGISIMPNNTVLFFDKLYKVMY